MLRRPFVFYLRYSNCRLLGLIFAKLPEYFECKINLMLALQTAMSLYLRIGVRRKCYKLVYQTDQFDRVYGERKA